MFYSGVNSGRVSDLAFSAIEQCGGLFECLVLGLDDVEIEEDKLKGNPADVDELSIT